MNTVPVFELVVSDHVRHNIHHPLFIAHIQYFLQHPSVTYCGPSRPILPDFDSVHAGVRFNRVLPHLRDVYSLAPCAAHSISVDMFHDLYPSLGDNLNPPVSFGMSSIMPVPGLAHAPEYYMLISVFRTLYISLYAFWGCDFTTFLSLLFRDLFVHAALMHCIPQEEPVCRVHLIYLLMMRSMILCHDFLARITIYYATQLTYRTTILRYEFFPRITAFYARQITFPNHCLNHATRHLSNARGAFKLGLIDLAHFSLPWLFIIIQITSLFVYHCPSFVCLSRCSLSKGDSTPSASPSFSCDEALCDRVLTYGGGRQHEFSHLEIKPYITMGNSSIYNGAAFKFVDHVDSLGQATYPIAQNFIHTNIPLDDIVPCLPVKVALKIARLHHLEIGSHVPKSEICRAFEGHNCRYCHLYVTVFAVVDSKSTRRRNRQAEKQSGNGVMVVSHAKNMNRKVVNIKSRGDKKLNSLDRATHHDRHVKFSKSPDTTPFPPPPVPSSQY